MPNTLTAITNLVKHQITTLQEGKAGANRIQHVGAALEIYVKDLYADSFNLTLAKKKKLYKDVFCYTGTSNHPPDAMLKGGDAIEIKKITGLKNVIQLNSSYPKHKLYCNNPFITKDCRDCEQWTEKDILYAIGNTLNKRLRLLWLVYGDCYSANINKYDALKTNISKSIKKIPNVIFNGTRELGGINSIDPLKITNLRIRGMWTIKNPNEVFSDLNAYDHNTLFQLVCLMRISKYLSFPKADVAAIEKIKKSGFKISNVFIKDPNYSKRNIKCKMITYKIQKPQ